jgi:SnoaL-like domain
MTLTTSTLDSVIVIWHVAVNNGDAATAAAACTDDVVVGGPKGDAAGRDEMRRWVESAGVRLMPRDCYDVPGGIVVEQDATWNSDNTGAAPLTVFSTFGLRNGSISSIHRFSTLEEARAFNLAA